jgi:hypothetical protein
MNYENYGIAPHPYTYMPALVFRGGGTIEWYDRETGRQLPPYFGYGEAAEKMVGEWYENQPLTLEG